MSIWADGEGYTTLEEVFASRDFGRRLPTATAAAAPVLKPAAQPRRVHLLTNRTMAVLSAGAAALSVVATLVVNGGGPSLSPVISAQQGSSNAPGSLTPVQPNAAGLGSGASGGIAGPGNGAATGSPATPGASAGAGAAVAGPAGSPISGGAAGGAGGTTVALGPSAGSATLTAFTTSRPAPAPALPAPTTTTVPPTISSGGASGPGHDNGKGNGGQNNGNGGGGGNSLAAVVVNGNGNGSNGHGRG